MQCDDCFQDPCRCHRTLTVSSVKYTVPQLYEFHECAADDCHVMIGVPTGSALDNTYCKWCEAKRQHVDTKGRIWPRAICSHQHLL